MKSSFIAWLLLLAACSSGEATAPAPGGTEVKNPFRGVMQDRSVSEPAQALYVEKCSMCHRQMGMGTVLLSRRADTKAAMLEQRRDLTASYLTLAVRQGIGNMPRISRAEVSDEQLQQIEQYLTKAAPK